MQHTPSNKLSLEIIIDLVNNLPDLSLQEIQALKVSRHDADVLGKKGQNFHDTWANIAYHTCHIEKVSARHIHAYISEHKKVLEALQKYAEDNKSLGDEIAEFLDGVLAHHPEKFSSFANFYTNLQYMLEIQIRDGHKKINRSDKTANLLVQYKEALDRSNSYQNLKEIVNVVRPILALFEDYQKYLSQKVNHFKDKPQKKSNKQKSFEATLLLVNNEINELKQMAKCNSKIENKVLKANLNALQGRIKNIVAHAPKDSAFKVFLRELVRFFSGGTKTNRNKHSTFSTHLNRLFRLKKKEQQEDKVLNDRYIIHK